MKRFISFDNLPDDIIPTQKDLERFLNNCTGDFRVTRKCIFWKGIDSSCESNKRIRMRFIMNKKCFRVQRLIYIWYKGEFINDKKHIKSICENKYCINPRHMIIKETNIKSKESEINRTNKNDENITKTETDKDINNESNVSDITVPS